MNVPNAIRSPVYAMGRPRLPGSERVAVRAAAADLPDSLSVSRKAARVAKDVVRAFLLDERRTDTLERALADAAQAMDPDPATAIALSPQSDVAGKFTAERVARYEARQCRQIGADAWHAETRAIASQVERQLARRFRDYLK